MRNTVNNLYGGGIYNDGSLTVTNCVFSGNSATNGGGIANAANLTVINCTSISNTASEGGGVFNYGPPMR